MDISIKSATTEAMACLRGSLTSVPNTKYQIPNTKYQIPNTKSRYQSQIPNSEYQIGRAPPGMLNDFSSSIGPSHAPAPSPRGTNVYVRSSQRRSMLKVSTSSIGRVAGSRSSSQPDPLGMLDAAASAALAATRPSSIIMPCA